MKITILTTGGTIEKTYNERDGTLKNYHTIMPAMLRGLRLPDLDITYKQVVFKDSLEITEDERQRIVAATQEALSRSDGIVILHGTDTMSKTGELLYQRLENLSIPVIMTGAMRPYEFRDSDALQNVTESLIAVRLVSPGVYVVIHNKVLGFPGVVKDRRRLSFTKR
jgi:L-asparaginase